MIPCTHSLRSIDAQILEISRNFKKKSALKFSSAILLLAVTVLPSSLRGVEEDKGIPWMADYATARELADSQGRMLFIFIYDDEANPLIHRFETETLGDAKIREKLENFICVRMPLNAKIKLDDEEVTLIEHPSFREMLGRPGIAIVDYKHRESAYHGYVVSMFPFANRFEYAPDKMGVILDLPRGTLTQRTLIYAVRTHPEKPAGADGGEASEYLLEEARQQAEYQAQSGVQGHQHWGSRFQRIVGRMRGGAPREICAESWQGQNLVEAAVECVRSWRTSAGHWSAIRGRNQFYGFDIKRGKNGIWYATGIVSTGGQDDQDARGITARI
jgi:hypothetical protein